MSDRHFIVPRRLVRRFLRVPDPVFRDPERLRRQLDRRSAAQDWPFLNIERFWAARIKSLGLWRRVRLLPYVPYLVRPAGGSTTWSVGDFDEERGYYIKYPTELERSELSQRFIHDQESWRRYLAPIRGARRRRELRRIYRERGLSERPFPLGEIHLRAFRVTRWTTSRRVTGIRAAVSGRQAKVVPEIGKYLRKVPGISPLLDARLRRITRRRARP